MGETERALFSIHINGTKEAVWNELTKPDEPQDALYHAVLHARGLEPGSPFQMRMPGGHNVIAIGEILEFDPPNLLKQRLRYTQYDDPYCTVTFEITDAPDGGVQFTLTVDDLQTDSKTSKDFKGSGGGEWVCKTLKQIIETGEASFSTRLMFRVSDLLGRRGQTKRTRAEHWPFDD